jgi:hypothetical protein
MINLLIEELNNSRHVSENLFGHADYLHHNYPIKENELADKLLCALQLAKQRLIPDEIQSPEVTILKPNKKLQQDNHSTLTGVTVVSLAAAGVFFFHNNKDALTGILNRIGSNLPSLK